MNINGVLGIPAWISVGVAGVLVLAVAVFLLLLILLQGLAYVFSGIRLRDMELSDLKDPAVAAATTARWLGVPIMVASYAAYHSSMALVLIPIYWIGLVIRKIL